MIKSYSGLLVLCVFMLTAQLTQLSTLMEWDRSLILHGETWRVITGNFTHINTPHLTMNLIALTLIVLTFSKDLIELLLATLTLSTFVGVCLLFTDTNVYVGFSGVLHGLFAYYALREVIKGQFKSGFLVLGGSLKIGYEQVFGAGKTTSEMIEATVSIDAHLIGYLSGLVLALLITTLKVKKTH